MKQEWSLSTVSVGPKTNMTCFTNVFVTFQPCCQFIFVSCVVAGIEMDSHSENSGMSGNLEHEGL